MEKRILFVFHGNICRSPMTEYIFKYLTKGQCIVESRATSREEIGNDIHPGTKEELTKHNIPFERHYAKQITLEDYHNFDIIICFDNYNLNNLKRMFKEDTSKIIKLLDYDIDDPWYTRDFDRTYKEIYAGCIKLKNKLGKEY